MKQSIFVLLLLSALNSSAQEKNISGDWIGTLSSGGNELKIIFHLKKDNTGVYQGSFDSPDEKTVETQMQTPQGLLSGTVIANTNNILFDSVRVKENSISLFGFEYSQPLYNGFIVNDSTMKGKWGVGTGISALNMKRIR